MKTLRLLALLLSSFIVLACRGESKELRIGVAPGPYGDIVTKAIQPSLERQGYRVKLVTFQDWVQPNLALDNKEIDLNIFQNVPYLEKFAKDRKLKLKSGIRIPTAGLGLYSSRIKAVGDLKPGDEVTLPLDVVNLARSLRFLQKQGIITFRSGADPAKVSEKDIDGNSYGLRFVPTEAAQLPRTLGTVALAVIPGNYAMASGLHLSDALALEELSEELKVGVAIRTEDENAVWLKSLVEAIESEEFHRVIERKENGFSSFQKPEWYRTKWGST
ncbi:MAG: MetQ/NlpA family ABC transporter substrate-binding protein [Polyangiaceae bacterium]